MLTYTYVEDVSSRRTPYRDAHLALADRFMEREELLIVGAIGAPPYGALLVFTSRAAAEEFADADPYGEAGLITERRVDPWNVVRHAPLPDSS